ncbi:PP2C family protein-serine/threonine phosphatase [Streptomyces sp. B93]|uniref:PP2C family protein-serine/threonine phosphatase n=1 Tax=Streptomyces sp. B93 TaxID=2824875 RepID=UPI001B39271D|nr:serine/threonine-protein phosphatase [Streptomyces sp. B93]
MTSPRSVSGGGGGQSLFDRYPQARRRDSLRRQQMLRVRGRSVAWLPPLVLLLGIVMVDIHTTTDFRMISWLVLVPGIAAAICGVWGTVVYAVLAPMTYVAVDSQLPPQHQAGPADLVLAAIGGVLATAACVVRVRGEARALHMADIADTVRRTLLRPMPSDWGGLDHAAVYLAADSDARVGGDFYDIQPGPYGTRVLLGDVQGKGLRAVETAAALLGTFREAAYHEPDLRTVARRLETRLRRHRDHQAALGRADGDRFATAVLLGFPPDAVGSVDVVNFGHDPPLVVGDDGEVRQLPPGDGLPLGLGELARPDGQPPPVRTVRVSTAETLLLTTDGVTEARDGRGAFYPLAREVAKAVAQDPRVARPRRLVTFVRDGTLRHCGGRLADDTTVFAVRRRPL